MKISYPSLGIGTVIGIAVAVVAILMTTSFSRDITFDGTFLVFGTVSAINEDTLSVDQSSPETGQETQIVRISMVRGTVLYGCVDSQTNSFCNVPIETNEVNLGTPVCAYVHLSEGQLNGGKIFLGSTCIVSNSSQQALSQ